MAPSAIPEASAATVLTALAPMTQLNCAYPSTAWLTGFLRAHHIPAAQADFSLGLALRIFSPEGLAAVRERALMLPSRRRSESTCIFLHEFSRYAGSIRAVIRFLQGRDPTLAHRIATRGFLPEGPRFQTLAAHEAEEGEDPLAWAFGTLGVQDRAKHFATLYLNDVADVVRHAVDPRFELVRYAETLVRSSAGFDALADALEGPPTLLDQWLEESMDAALAVHRPGMVLLSVPFPGCVYGAFRLARRIKQAAPDTVVVLGGGFVNTELRSLSDARVFSYVDFVTLDDGERPLLSLLEWRRGQRRKADLSRTFYLEDGAVVYSRGCEPDLPLSERGTPTWEGLKTGDYLSALDLLNPMHRLWSDGWWNKLALEHGCYWHQCAFCDTTLDYIARYERLEAATVVDHMEAAMAQTGQSGFHFVDEAASPAALRALALEINRRGLAVTWWTNIRFEKAFTPALCRLLAESGCVAVAGGLEVAEDRLLKRMKKGVTLAQAARAANALSEAGILVHAYLMYGFPGQSAQETVDALDAVRQLFAAGCIQSGFFHRFACTVHSDVGGHPSAYGIRLLPSAEAGFARNDVGFEEKEPAAAHERLGVGLEKALYNFMHGIGLEWDVREWFEEDMPASTLASDWILQLLP
ncbi:MAG: radical SAM protein [Verrucomicrobiota bacterium]|jgi:hypothetical protein|nr:radical SAM protein [Verrucomicrobiota bacterium]